MRIKQPIFFFHLPKTGGETVRGFIESVVGKEQVCPDYTWSTLLVKDQQYLNRYQVFSGHFYGPLEQITEKRFFSFSLLRDPIDRALSHYGHIVRDPAHYLHARTKELGNFEAYLHDPITSMTVSNFQARMLAFHLDIETLYQNLNHESRQWGLERFIETTDSGISGQDLLTAAKIRLGQFEIVGVTERLNDFIALLCHRLHWQYPEALVNRNVNSNRINCEHLPESVIARLKQINVVDMALYDWSKQEFHAKFTMMLAELINNRKKTSWLRTLLPLQHG